MAEANIEASGDTVISVSDISSVTQADMFAEIRSGALDEELLNAGVSQELIDAVELYYRTHYYSQYGEYVSGTSNSIKCSDKNIYGEEGCLKNKGRLFLAWNMRSHTGRLVGTDVYIERLEIKTLTKKLLDVRRGVFWMGLGGPCLFLVVSHAVGERNFGHVAHVDLGNGTHVAAVDNHAAASAGLECG